VNAPAASLTELRIADRPEAWSALGFHVEDGAVRIDGVTIRLVGTEAGRGIVGWGFDVAVPDAIDGLPTVSAPPADPPRALHPNGAGAVDHVVVLTDEVARTRAALAEIGLEPRRTVEGMAGDRAILYTFFRMGPAILELIGPPAETGSPEPGLRPTTPAPRLPENAARFWGLAFVIDDLDGLADRLGDDLRHVHDAVQPGRRIASLRSSAGLSVPVAFMTPDPRRAPA
jgi:hypothetical protein